MSLDQSSQRGDSLPHSSGASLTPEEGPPVGREGEGGLLLKLLDDASRGAGRSMEVTGERGIGKSHLLGWLRREATRRGFLVLSTDASGQPARIGYGALHELLAPVLDLRTVPRDSRHGPLVAALTGASTDAVSELTVLDAIHGLVRECARSHPVLIAVDDLDGLDRPSREALSFLIARLGRSRVAAVTTAREPLGAALNRTVALQRLDERSSARLAGAVAPSLSGAARLRAVDESEGNPLTLLELLASRHVRTPDPALGAALDGLTADERDALLLLALDEAGDLYALADAGIGLGALEAPERRGLIAVDVRTFTARFVHPLIRHAVRGRATSEERRRMHLVLARRAVSPDIRARHLADALTEPDAETADLLEQSARRAAARGDFSEAAWRLSRAARLSSSPSDRRRRLAQSAYWSACNGDYGVSRDPNIVSLAEAGPEAGSLYATGALIYAGLSSGLSLVDACRRFQSAVDARGSAWRTDDREVQDALGAWLMIVSGAGVTDFWDAFFDALGRLAPEPPEQLVALAWTFADPARTPVALRRKVAALSESHAELEPGREVSVRTAGLSVGNVVHLVDPPSDRPARAGVSPSGRAVQALEHFNAGAWDDADDAIRRASAFIGDSVWRPEAAPIHYVGALLGAVRGDDECFLEHVHTLDGLAVRLGGRRLAHFGHHARALEAAGRGDWEHVYRHATAVCPPGTLPRYTPEALWVSFDLVEAALHTRRDSEAADHVRALEAAGIDRLSARFLLLTRAAAGLADQTQGWDDRIEGVLALPLDGVSPFDRARVRLAYGMRLRRERNAVRAREQLILALDAFDRLGAVPWAGRARSELRVGTRTPAPTNAVTHESLTPQEREVAELAAQGLTNKEIGERLFVSARTVSGHLYRIFPKLGIVSRSALRDALSSETTAPAPFTVE